MNNSVHRYYVVTAPDLPHARKAAIDAAYLDGDIEHINPRNVERFTGREVEPHDLELYAINTGQFYETHKALANKIASLQEWRRHVTHIAVPRYGREVEPVYATAETLDSVAANLKAYYERHISESAASVIRYVGTYINSEGERTLMTPAQGRNTFATAEDAQRWIAAVTNENSMDTIKQVWGDNPRFEVRPCPCYPVHFDPQNVWFGEVPA